MDLQELLEQRKISKYHLSKVSGVPKTTIMDICAGRSDIDRCSAKTVQQLAKALGCTRFVEFGPGKVLSGLIKKIDAALTTVNVSDLASLDATLAALG